MQLGQTNTQTVTRSDMIQVDLHSQDSSLNAKWRLLALLSMLRLAHHSSFTFSDFKRCHLSNRLSDVCLQQGVFRLTVSCSIQVRMHSNRLHACVRQYTLDGYTANAQDMYCAITAANWYWILLRKSWQNLKRVSCHMQDLPQQLKYKDTWTSRRIDGIKCPWFKFNATKCTLRSLLYAFNIYQNPLYIAYFSRWLRKADKKYQLIKSIANP